MRMKCLRIFPDTIPRISCSLLSSLSLNMALGNAVVTVASTSIGSLLGIQEFSKPSIVFHIHRPYKPDHLNHPPGYFQFSHSSPPATAAPSHSPHPENNSKDYR